MNATPGNKEVVIHLNYDEARQYLFNKGWVEIPTIGGDPLYAIPDGTHTPKPHYLIEAVKFQISQDIG